MIRQTILLALVGLAVLGCSKDGEMSKKDEQELRNNFTRKLTPEEIARMGGGSKPAGAPSKGK